MSQWLPIPFEEPLPRLTGHELMRAQKNLKSKMRNAHKSIGIVTSYLHDVLKNHKNPRAGESFVVLLYCVKKVYIILN
jgi:hypothetical protein